MAVASIGLTPMSPLIVEPPVVEIPVFARIEKLQADPRSTVEVPITPGIIATIISNTTVAVIKRKKLFLSRFLVLMPGSIFIISPFHVTPAYLDRYALSGKDIIALSQVYKK